MNGLSKSRIGCGTYLSTSASRVSIAFSPTHKNPN